MKRLIPSVAVRIEFKDVIQFLGQLFSFNKDIISDFKQRLIDIAGFRYVTLYATARYGMMVLLKTLKINNKGKDEIILPSYTCPTVLFSIINAGLKPVVADINISTFNIDLKKIQERITNRTLAVIIADMFGKSAESGELKHQLLEKNIYVIQDAAQSFPEKEDFNLSMKPDFTIISFGKGKYLTTVQGGAIVSDCQIIMDQLTENVSFEPKTSFMQHMMLFAKMLLFPILVRPEIFRLVFPLVKNEISSAKLDKIPSNWRFTRIQAAMGFVIINNLATLKKQRLHSAESYSRRLSDISQIILPVNNGNKFLRYCFLVEDKKIQKRIIDKLNNNGCMISTPNFDLSSYEHFFQPADIMSFTNSKKVFDLIICLPTHGYVSEKDILRIADLISLEINEAF